MPATDKTTEAKGKLEDGEQLLAKGQLDAALVAYKEGLRQLPTDARTIPLHIAVYNRMGLALGSARRFDEAIATFRSAIELFPNDSNLQNNLGVTLENAGGPANTHAALAAFKSALHLDPKSTSAHDNVVAALRREGRTAEANHVASAAPNVQTLPNPFGS